MSQQSTSSSARVKQTTSFDKILTASSMDEANVLSWLVAIPGGLTEDEAERRLSHYGKNKIVHEKPNPWYVMLLNNFKDPFILVLIFLGVVSYITKDVRAVVIVSTMVGISIVLRFVQEFRSSKAAEKLQAMVKTTATVQRQFEEEKPDGSINLVSRFIEIPLEEIVPGDIIKLSAGDMIPADIRLISSKDLFVSQSALTGEALPVEKESKFLYSGNTDEEKNKTSVLEKKNICFLGSDVVSGTATAVVVTTGDATFFGSLAKNVLGHRSETSFDKGIKKVSLLLIRFMAVMVPAVFVINGLSKGDWSESFIFAIAVAVGLTPEMLPVVVTANLAKGAVSMAKEKVVVKKINSIQNLGAMDILCTDKTGTITQDKIVLIEYLDIHGEKYAPVLEYAYMNSYYQTGLKNLLDRAVLEFAELEAKLKLPDTKKIDEIPFDFIRRRMSVVIERDDNQLLICKGAIEEIIKVCTQVEDKGKIIPLTDEIRNDVMSLTRNLNESGLRIIAVAYKKTTPADAPYNVNNENDLILAGFIDFLDPPKETAAAAITELKEDGVRVKILTGDNDLVTRHICKAVNMDIEHLTLGNEIDSLSLEELALLANKTTVFAKVSPDQKARIIKALQSKGHVVGFMGDGINDAPALRQADVGISVDTAADIAKESSDIILLEKSLLVLKTGVIHGRTVYGNIIKYIKMTASSNFGNVFSIIAASIFLPFLPMLPIHLLIQNLLYDFSQLSIPWDKMDKKFLLKPRKWDPSGIARFMFFIGPISSVFDIITFSVLWFVFAANVPEHQAFFHSGWFIEGLLSQILIVHMIRTPKVPFFQSIATTPVLLMTGLIMAIGVYIPFSSFGHALGLASLPSTYFWWLFGILLSYCVLTQMVKVFYIRKFNTWL